MESLGFYLRRGIMIDFWLSKNVADALYGLIVLAMFFIIMFIVSDTVIMCKHRNRCKCIKDMIKKEKVR